MIQIKPNLRRAIGAAACTAVIGLVTAGAASAASFTTNGAWTFTSEPNLHPPKLRTTAPPVAGSLAPGYFLVANFKNATLKTQQVGQGGPLIVDSHLQPVWFHPVASNLSATNLRTQSYKGKPVLTWWQGTITSTGATTSGTDVVVDQHYKTVASLDGTGGWVLSPHEFLISGTNAWVTAYKVLGPMNLSAYGGAAQGYLLDSAVQEYSLKTGRLLYTWDIKDHVPLTESETHAPPVSSVAWDAYHVNSIQLTGDGFLTSMRNTWAAYMVNKATGNIDWKLGGKASTFALAANAQFAWQHDVQLHAGNQISMFDDACCNITAAGFGPPLGPSRGLILALNTSAHTATVVHEYTHGTGFNAAFLGNTQLLPNGNVLVGWGSKPYFSEYSSSGRLLFDAVLPGPDVSYRAFVSTWAATPSVPPAGAARKSGGRDTVYASWDGATSVAAWRVLAGPDLKHLASVAVRARSGFETTIRLNKAYRAFKVQGLDAKGHALGTSRLFAAARSGSGGGGGGPKVCFYPPC